MRVAYKIPLIGKSPVDPLRLAPALASTVVSPSFRRTVERLNIETRPHVIIKPQRRLGGAWIDELVSQRKVVVLCNDCIRKYAAGMKKNCYEARETTQLSDCDGCSTEMTFCLGFYARLTT